MSSRRIVQDENEFIGIIRGKIKREDLKEFIKRGEIVIPGEKGKGFIIPMPEIYIPKLKFAPPQENTEDSKSGEGDGDGDGSDGVGEDLAIGQDPNAKPGDILGKAEDEGEGKGKKGGERKAGKGGGGREIDIELSEKESIELLMEMLELPKILPKGSKYIKTKEKRYTEVREVGPDSLRHKKRTYKEALKRQITEGVYNPMDPKIVPIKRDKRYRSSVDVTKPQNNAVVFYMMDVSGSMSDDDRQIVRYACSLISFWLRANYDGVEEVWLIHDDDAERVDRKGFFGTQRSGGTSISCVHELMIKIIDQEFPASQWNIYPFYFSDGFNWGGDDAVCLKLLKDKILNMVNQYAHAEIAAERSWYPRAQRSSADVSKFSPAGSFGRMLLDNFRNDDRVAMAGLHKMEEVPDAIKVFFKKGR